MALILTWDDKNLDVDGFRIYRSDTVILPYALPPPLATVGPGVFEYVDDSALRNKLYHYCIGAFKGTEESVSQDRILCNMPYTGPGPQQLLRGTWENGYFGRVASGDLFDAGELVSFANAIFDTVLWGSINRPVFWSKFIYKGKILFFPSDNIAAVRASEIYKAGLFYGNEPSSGWANYLKTTYGVIPQGRTIQKGEDLFLIRNARCREVLGSETQVVPDSYRGNEFDLCFGLAYAGKKYGVTMTSTPMTDDIVNSGGYFHTMDILNAQGNNRCLMRGGVVFDDIGGSNYETYYQGIDYCWRPVLELIL